MDMLSEELRRFLDNQRSGMTDGQLPVPSTAHLAFIPQRQRSSTLLMVSEAPRMEVLPTIFIGTIRPNYTNEMWLEDVNKWKKHFENYTTPKSMEIPLLPLRENATIMDSTDAIPKIENVLPSINELPSAAKIRIICLGTGHSIFLYQAISYLLQEWREPGGERRVSKHMQFITSGDTENRDMSDFCQWLCISGACQSVAFYNTMMYHPFGYCHSQYIGRK